MLKLITIPLSWFYAIAVAIRNKMFDWNIYKSVEHKIPIVCVGNIAVGGTGKTPHTELMIKLLSRYYRVAVLSRGYKRKTKGFYEVKVNSRTKNVGDEPKQIKIKFPTIPVAVCEKRNIGIAKLQKLYPQVNLIVMDDGFQHRYTETWLNVILTDHANPLYEDHILPWGSLRESAHSIARANIVIVTKMPEKVKPIEMRLISKYLNLYPYQNLFFTRMVQKEPIPVFNEIENCNIRRGSKVIALSAIAKPKSFSSQLSKRYNVVDTLSYPDHYKYKKSDLNVMMDRLKEYGDDTIILMTEKDAVKFASSKKIPRFLVERMYKVPIEVEFVEADLTRNNTKEYFLEKVLPYVEKNQKYNVLGM